MRYREQPGRRDIHVRAQTKRVHNPTQMRSRQYLQKRQKYFTHRAHHYGQNRKYTGEIDRAFKRKSERNKKTIHERYPIRHTYQRNQNKLPPQACHQSSLKNADISDEESGNGMRNEILHFIPSSSESGNMHMDSETSNENGIEIEGEYEVLSEIESDEDFESEDQTSRAHEDWSHIPGDKELGIQENAVQNYKTNSIPAASESSTYFSHASPDVYQMANLPSNYGFNEQGEIKDIETYHKYYDQQSVWQIPIIQVNEAPMPNAMTDREGPNFYRLSVPRYCKPIPPNWNPKNCSDDENDDFISSVINCLMKNGGSMALDDVRKTLKDQENIVMELETDLKSFLEEYPNNFLLEENDVSSNIVHCKTSLKLCPLFSAPKPKACNESCNSLHACAFHILSKCNTFCDRSRHFIYSSQHNKRVLRSHLLHKLAFNNLKILLKRAQSRNGIIFPQICSHYNVEHGCRDMDDCSFIHVCKYVMHEDGCKFGQHCKRSHDIFDEHNKKVYMKYGLNENINEEQIKHEMISTSKLIFGPMSRAPGTERNDAITRNMVVENKDSVEEDNFDSKSESEEETKTLDIGMQDLGNEENKHVAWTLTDKSTRRKSFANSTETDELERRYQEFCKARLCEVSVDGVRYTIDMVTMQGKKDNSSEEESFVFKRCIKQSPDFIPLD